MAEINDALPTVASNIPSNVPPSPDTSYPSVFPLYQQILSPSAYPSAKYRQPYSDNRPLAVYGPEHSGTSYDSLSLYQQPLDRSPLQFQYGGLVEYRNSPMESPVSLPHHPFRVQRLMQQGQQQVYNVRQYQYQYQYQQQFPQASVPRAISMPTYTISAPSRSPQPFLPLTINPFYPQSYLLTTASPLFSVDEGSVSRDPGLHLPRGPPRKPKQSGFALWVGNLPRDILLEELKEFFALEGLESIFLIRKSNCAFVNYRTEETCSHALSIFNNKSK